MAGTQKERKGGPRKGGGPKFADEVTCPIMFVPSDNMMKSCPDAAAKKKYYDMSLEVIHDVAKFHSGEGEPIDRKRVLALVQWRLEVHSRVVEHKVMQRWDKIFEEWCQAKGTAFIQAKGDSVTMQDFLKPVKPEFVANFEEWRTACDGALALAVKGIRVHSKDEQSRLQAEARAKAAAEEADKVKKEREREREQAQREKEEMEAKQRQLQELTQVQQRHMAKQARALAEGKDEVPEPEMLDIVEYICENQHVVITNGESTEVPCNTPQLQIVVAGQKPRGPRACAQCFLFCSDWDLPPMKSQFTEKRHLMTATEFNQRKSALVRTGVKRPQPSSVDEATPPPSKKPQEEKKAEPKTPERVPKATAAKSTFPESPVKTEVSKEDLARALEYLAKNTKPSALDFLKDDRRSARAVHKERKAKALLRQLSQPVQAAQPASASEEEADFERDPSDDDGDCTDNSEVFLRGGVRA